MGRIDDTFQRARAEHRGVVMPFLTAGDPSIPLTITLLDALQRAGAGAAEIGIPFSDPIADGPVIAASMHDALVRGVTPRAIFDALRDKRCVARGGDVGGTGAAGEESMANGRRGSVGTSAEGSRASSNAASPASTSLPAVAMVSVSIVQRMGLQRFVEELVRAGLDGLIVPDADVDSAEALSRECAKHSLACSFLVAPTSTPERVAQIVRHCRGFVYLLARAGVTGESAGLPELSRQVAQIRAVNATIPIAAGFGIATPEQVRATVAQVDGAIVGSALVRRISAAIAAGRDPVEDVEAYVASLVAAAQR